MRTLLCCIGRHENQYIREYVEYYKKLGFTNICLYDNNRDGEERFEDVIGDYIESGFVILKNYRNRLCCQMQAYQECYREYNKEYDWIAFFDCDEFLCFSEDLTISDYLSRDIFKKYMMIHINWCSYDDNGLVYNDKNCGVLERFDREIPENSYEFKENIHIKSILRSGINNITWTINPHRPGIKISCCNNCGVSCEPTSPFCENINYDLAYIKHFSRKTAEEYCHKLIRGYPDFILQKSCFKNMVVGQFFAQNKITLDKINVCEKILNINLDELKNKVKNDE